MPHKTHHIQSMYYQSNQWMLSNVSVWWQNVVTMMYSLQWGIASYHLAVRYCSPQGLLGQKPEGIVLPGMAHSTTSQHCVAPCHSKTCALVIIGLSCNNSMSYQKQLNIDTAPWTCFVGYSPIFPDWSQISGLQRAIASKAAETVTEIDEDTAYAMLCTGGLVHKHIT